MRLTKAPLAAAAFILLFSTVHLQSQVFSKFGIKAGFITTGLSTFNEYTPYSLDKANTHIYDNSDFFNFLSYDIGIYAELFNYKEFCVSTELHYLVKGEEDKAVYQVPHLIGSFNGQNIWETGSLIDEASYLSLQILPRYRAGISEKGEDNVYFFAGPVFNFMLSDNGTYTQPKYIVNKDFPGDIGGAFGLGFEINRKFMLELKLDYSLTGSYDFTYGNQKINRSYNTFSVLTGFALSEIFK